MLHRFRLHGRYVGYWRFGRLGVASALALFCLFLEPASAETPDELLAQVNSGVCPGDLTTYDNLSGNQICDPGRANTQACDASFTAPSWAWQQCYDDVSDCRRRVDEENRKISAYNSFMYQCRPAFYSSTKRPWSLSRYTASAPAGLSRSAAVPVAAPQPDPQFISPNPYDPDPLRHGAGDPPGYGGVSVDVAPQKRESSGLGGLAGQVKKLQTN